MTLWRWMLDDDRISNLIIEDVVERCYRVLIECAWNIVCALTILYEGDNGLRGYDAAVRRGYVPQQSSSNPRSLYPLPSIPPDTGSTLAMGARVRSRAPLERRDTVQHTNCAYMLPPLHQWVLWEGYGAPCTWSSCAQQAASWCRTDDRRAGERAADHQDAGRGREALPPQGHPC